VAGTALLHAAELEDATALGPLLGAEVPADWPPANGPPDERGSVEIGYTVVADRRGRGYATEAVRALVVRAFERGATRVLAYTRPDNLASIAVLTKCRFRPSAVTERPEMLGFERLREA
jgi:RimJ/RimL family protein N-acetyltransferase